MLRWLVFALLLANALFWAWSQGWLSPLVGAAPGAQREPWRLQQQLRPERVRVLPPDTALPPASPAASAASAPLGAASTPAAPASAASATVLALACFESGPLAGTALDAAEQALAGVLPGRGWIRASRETPARHAVVIGPLGGREALQKKRDELARLGLAAEELRLPGDAGIALVLSRHDTAAAAQAALDALSPRGVRTARVLALPGGEVRLRIENATPAQADALRALKVAALGSAGLAPCATTPAPPAALTTLGGGGAAPR